MSIELEKHERVIQEYVPGKEVTLMHLIANPDSDVLQAMQYSNVVNTVGLITISPGEAAIIAADLAIKSGDVSVARINEGNGSVVIHGDMSSVECALEKVSDVLSRVMRFAVCPITRT